MRNVYLFQVNWENCAGNTPGFWLPYSAGALWAFCKTDLEINSEFELKRIFFRRTTVEVVVRSMEEPDVVGFCNYLWTEQYNLSVAAKIKSHWPNVLIVFGGPQVPDQAHDYLIKYPFIDLVVHSEGEVAFAKVLHQRLEESPQYLDVNGCTIRTADGIQRTRPVERIRDLENLPSPYLLGVFDHLLEEHPNAEWNAVIETNRGCPYRCSFCDWGTLTYSKVTRFGLQRVFNEIKWLARNRISYILPADANFGIFAERDAAIIEQFVLCKNEYGYPSAVGMSFAKNSNLRIVEMAERLHCAGLLKALTLSTQSMSPDVLDAIERKNMAFSDFESILEECERRALPTYTELILGLPRETYTSWKAGLCRALEAGQHNQLESWLLEMLPNSPLSDPLSRRLHGIRTAKLTNYCFVFDLQAPDDIPEEVELVYATKYMPFADFQLSMGFSMLIYNLHAYGWSQIISRFLNRVADVPFLAFYDRLENWIQSNPQTILYREYVMTIETIKQMIDTSNYVVDRFLLDEINVGSIPIGLRSQGFLHLEAEAVFAELEHFTRTEFGRKLGQLGNDVFEFQRQFVTTSSRSYPYEQHFDNDIWGLVRTGVGKGIASTYQFSLTYAFKDLRDFIEKIYSRKKQGFGKAIVKQLACPDTGSLPASMVGASYGDEDAD